MSHRPACQGEEARLYSQGRGAKVTPEPLHPHLPATATPTPPTARPFANVPFPSRRCTGTTQTSRLALPQSSLVWSSAYRHWASASCDVTVKRCASASTWCDVTSQSTRGSPVVSFILDGTLLLLLGLGDYCWDSVTIVAPSEAVLHVVCSKRRETPPHRMPACQLYGCGRPPGLMRTHTDSTDNTEQLEPEIEGTTCGYIIPAVSGRFANSACSLYVALRATSPTPTGQHTRHETRLDT
eukprot:scaffold25548_cov163-Isochrysis_galbana.AAC.1